MTPDEVTIIDDEVDPVAEAVRLKSDDSVVYRALLDLLEDSWARPTGIIREILIASRIIDNNDTVNPDVRDALLYIEKNFRLGK